MRTTTKKTAPDKTTSRTEFMYHRLDWSPLDAIGKVEHICGEVFVTIDKRRRAVIRLTNSINADHFDRLAVRILNKLTGEIDNKTFTFGDELRGVKRIDDRTDWRPEVLAPFYAWAGSMGTFDWYIAVPATTLPITNAVAAYIAQFV